MRVAPSFLASLAAVGLVAFAACGGKVVASGPAEADFPAAVTNAVCANLQPCCRKNAFDYSADACATRTNAWVTSLAEGVHPGDSYDPAAAAACIARLAQGAEQCDPSLGLNPIFTACLNVYSGPRQPGESCVSTADCAPPPAGSTVQCDHEGPPVEDGGVSPGTCLVITPGSVGASCGLPSSEYVDCSWSDRYGAPTSFYCDTKTDTCQRALGLGAVCDPSQVSCGAGLVCEDVTSTSLESTCASDPAYAGDVPPGSPCETDQACAGQGWCLHGATTPVCISSFMAQFCSAGAP